MEIKIPDFTIPDLTFLPKLDTEGLGFGMLLGGAGIFVAYAVVRTTQYLIRPWWETRKMRADLEKKESLLMARATLNMLQGVLQAGEVSADSIPTWHKRFANLLPMKELMRDPDFVPLKEFLEKKHPKQMIHQIEAKEEPKAPEPVVKTGVLSALTSQLVKKTATA